MTSIGVTTATASVMPAARPASARMSITASGAKWSYKPRNVARPDTVPVSRSAMDCLYRSYDVNRIAIFGTIPVTTAPSPLYNPSGVSLLIISFPVVRNPRLLAWNVVRQALQVELSPYTRRPSSPRQLHPNFDGICNPLSYRLMKLTQIAPLTERMAS